MKAFSVEKKTGEMSNNCLRQHTQKYTFPKEQNISKGNTYIFQKKHIFPKGTNSSK